MPAGPSFVMTSPSEWSRMMVLSRSWTIWNSPVPDVAAIAESVRRELADAGCDLLRIHHEPVLEDVVVGNARDVGAGDPRDRPVEVVEGLLGDDRRDLGSVATEPVVL